MPTHVDVRRHCRRPDAMDTILVVNAGSSSVKFQIFGIEGAGALHRLIKGQIDGIGTRPRLTAQASDKSSLINRTYASNEVPDVPAAIAVVAAWLRETQSFNLIAVGHRGVHGGPKHYPPGALHPGPVPDPQPNHSPPPPPPPNHLPPTPAPVVAPPEIPPAA